MSRYPLIALWSHPRSMSTATERIMRERGDCQCFHEPFMYYYYVHCGERQFPHFDVDPDQLQPHVPFELDLFENRRAFVTLVAFTMRRMRPRRGGRIGFRPLSAGQYGEPNPARLFGTSEFGHWRGHACPTLGRDRPWRQGHGILGRFGRRQRGQYQRGKLKSSRAAAMVE